MPDRWRREWSWGIVLVGTGIADGVELADKNID
jgi:hypothetical protein